MHYQIDPTAPPWLSAFSLQDASRRHEPLGNAAKGHGWVLDARLADHEVHMPKLRTAAAVAAREHTQSEGQQILLENANPTLVIRVLLDVNELTQSELADMIGVDERSIRRWAASIDSPTIKIKHAHSIDDLRYLHSVLSPSLPEENLGRWMRARNRRLDGKRPVEEIAAGHYEKVRKAAEAFAAGSPSL